MCKYCDLAERDGIESFNGTPTIGRIKDGSQIYEIWFNRYICKSDKVHKNELVLAHSVKTSGSALLETVNTKSIKIKYCPFCGQEL